MTSTSPDNFPITFEHRSTIATTMDAMIAFHEDPAAFSRLTPPPIFSQIHRRDWRSMRDAEIEFTLWFLIVPLRWAARHEPGPTPTSFVDRQVKGPVKVWVHRHLFEQTNDGILLIDRLTILHHMGIRGVFTRLLFNTPSLRLLFLYRHLRTRFGVKHFEHLSTNA